MILRSSHLAYQERAIAAPRFNLEEDKIIIYAYGFDLYKQDDGSFAPKDGKIKFERIAEAEVSNDININPETLKISDEGTPAFTYFKTRTVADLVPNFNSKTKEEIGAQAVYDLIGDPVEKFLLANGYVTGEQL